MRVSVCALLLMNYIQYVSYLFSNNYLSDCSFPFSHFIYLIIFSQIIEYKKSDVSI